MSTKDILRKYLDILNESSEQSTPAAGIAMQPEQIIPPQDGDGSIRRVSEALRAFQKAAGKQETGLPDFETIGELKSSKAPEAQSVKEAVAAYQKTKQMPNQTGDLDPMTLAEMISDSGSLRDDEAAKIQKGFEQAKSNGQAEEPALNESAMVADPKAALEHKASLHEGYSQGLRGVPVECSHEVGTPHHSHHMHGHMLGKKEFDECWNPVANVAM